ncbi:MAG: Urocanate hydratase, partial [uncultured Ramlibacter sp.]
VRPLASPLPCRRPAPGARAARIAAQLRRLVHRGGLPHDPEQPGPGGRREPGRAGRLRRHRQGGAQLAGVRRHPRFAAQAQARRDAAGAVGQAGRRVPHPCGRTPGVD